MPNRVWLIFTLALLYAGCAPLAFAKEPVHSQVAASVSTPALLAPLQHPLPDLGLAPELENTVWLNVEQPLRLSALHGKVVLLDMWTLGCINCQHVIPSLRDLHEKYAAQGLVIIGNHYPEFSYEQDLKKLKAAIEEYRIPYAVAQDNDGQTWQAYDNRYWPTLYLIDKQGHIRYVHIGEGAYQETESAVLDLLAEPA